MSDVTVLGLGTMGQALSRALLKAGHKVTVWNRTAGKDEELAAEGAIPVQSLHDAVRSSSLIIICVLDYSAVRAVLEPIEQDLSKRVLVNLTTGKPDEARRMNTWAASRNIDYIDGGIMAVPPLIGTESALILYSGSSKNTFENHYALLKAMGQARYVGADPGLASLLELAMNAAVIGMIGGVVHAMAMTATENTDIADFAKSLLMPCLKSIAEFIPHFAQQIASGDYTQNVLAQLGPMSVALADIRRVSHDLNVSTELLDPIQKLIDRRIASGFPHDEFSGVCEELKLDRTGNL
ncbi:NAD(P)-binding domain-containing protein [Mycetohabitans sp. B8]|uniref:NAD(P)-dependent oxidoreductase n=1 Tax=Mycetohabitans sp. B8 TaxID=2841845 RepID=UPI001F028370|nr:NAD(P)-binding domain-containing protein [Mycetohabitans sp. B8]MCG1042452.1 NAD(P)-binding domain-containing protein [Mycetohabitans sp. B8]